MLDREGRALEAEILNLLNFERRDRLDAVGDHLPGERASHGAHARVVVVQVGDLRIVQSFDKLGFGFGDLIDGLEKFEMHRIHIGDDALIGLRNRSQLADFTFGGHPHFQHADVLIFLRPKEAQRQAEFVIQVANRSQNRELFAEDSGDHFLRCGLSGAPCDTDDRRSPFSANIAGLDRGLHANRWRLIHFFLDNNGSSLFFQSLPHKLMPIEARPFDREEQFAGIDRSAID